MKPPLHTLNDLAARDPRPHFAQSQLTRRPATKRHSQGSMASRLGGRVSRVRLGSSTIRTLSHTSIENIRATGLRPECHITPLAGASSRDSARRSYSVVQRGQARQLARTALYDLHKRHDAKLVPFGGYEMPLQYADLSVGDSHLWTREKASLFDVGHM